MHLIKFSSILLLLSACIPDPVEEAGSEPAMEEFPREQAVYCPAVYDPVCAIQEIKCVAGPCDPIQKSFGNSCEADRANFKTVSRGRC